MASNLLTILFGVKKSAEEAKKKKGVPRTGMIAAGSKAYKEAQETLDAEDPNTKVEEEK